MKIIYLVLSLNLVALACCESNIKYKEEKINRKNIIMKESKMNDNKTIVRQYIENIINTGNTDSIAKYISPNYTEVFNNKRYQVGIDGAIKHIKGVRETYPDLVLQIDHQILEGEWVATCYTMRGTHLGEWIGIKPTGKKIEVTGVNIDRIVDGRIIEHGGAANLFNALLDIEAIKIVGSK